MPVRLTRDRTEGRLSHPASEPGLHMDLIGRTGPHSGISVRRRRLVSVWATVQRRVPLLPKAVSCRIRTKWRHLARPFLSSPVPTRPRLSPPVPARPLCSAPSPIRPPPAVRVRPRRSSQRPAPSFMAVRADSVRLSSGSLWSRGNGDC